MTRNLKVPAIALGLFVLAAGSALADPIDDAENLVNTARAHADRAKENHADPAVAESRCLSRAPPLAATKAAEREGSLAANRSADAADLAIASGNRYAESGEVDEAQLDRDVSAIYHAAGGLDTLAAPERIVVASLTGGDIERVNDWAFHGIVLGRDHDARLGCATPQRGFALAQTAERVANETIETVSRHLDEAVATASETIAEACEAARERSPGPVARRFECRGGEEA